VAPSLGLLGKSWVLGAAIAFTTLLPGSRVLCGRICNRSRMIVPVALAFVCMAMMTLLGGDETYEFIYFKF
jgi:hypothetical protein